MMRVEALKTSASAFFVSVGTLWLLHLLVGWPTQRAAIWVPAIAVGIGAFIVQAWKARKGRPAQ